MLPTATTSTQPPPPAIRTQSRLRRLLRHLDSGAAVAAARRADRRSPSSSRWRARSASTSGPTRSTTCARPSGQLLALQDIQVRVVHADAIASSSYLRSGQEDPAQRTAYLDEIAKAGDGLVAVSSAANACRPRGAQPGQPVAGCLRRSGRAGQGQQPPRVSGRRDLPTPGQRDRQQRRSRCSRHRLVAAHGRGVAARPDQRQPGHSPSGRPVVDRHRGGCCSLSSLSPSLLAVAHVPPARQHPDRRRPAVVVRAGARLRWQHAGRSISDVDDAVDNQLSAADSAAQARSAGFEAQSQEALTLINRGNGAANEANWQRSNDVVTQLLGGELGSDESLSVDAHDSYTSYRDAHVEIRGLDDGGNWDAAVAASLGNESTPNGINAVDRVRRLRHQRRQDRDGRRNRCLGSDQ